MSQTRLEFYATPSEQREWLKRPFSEPGIWGLVWRYGEGYRYFPDGLCDVENLQFGGENEDELMLFLGRRDLAETPAWRATPRGDQIDFKKSRAIQFVPSLTICNHILLEGRIAILRPSEYQTDEIPSKPLLQWFRQVARSLYSLKAPGTILTQRTADGSQKEWQNVIVSSGAVAWRCAGGCLKQFPKGMVEFDLQTGRKAGEPESQQAGKPESRRT